MTAPKFNPFPGLRPFEDDRNDILVFFGRDQQVGELLSRLHRSRRFVAVVGESGCGKSSLIRAGLLPALHAGFLAGAGSHWRIALLRPSDGGVDRPIESLAQALETAEIRGNPADEKAVRIALTSAALHGGARGLVETIEQARLDAGENVLIVVDQFEELFGFRHGAGETYVSDEAAAFVKLLLEAAGSTDVPVYVLITMRSDYIGDCAKFPKLPETLNDGLFLVPRLTPDQLREAIEGPVRVAGANIAPRLVNRILNELGEKQDELPVLQHALMRMWNVWAEKPDRSATLDVVDYEAIGGLAQALSRHANEVLGSLSARLQPIAERVFKALTQRGNDNKSGVRCRRAFTELCEVANAEPSDVRDVVNAFRARNVSFLTPQEQIPLDDATVVDLTHEALMRTWDKLIAWVDEEGEAAKEYARLVDAADERAKQRARGRDLLLVEPRLSLAEEWRDRNHPTAAWAARYGGDFAAVAALIADSRAEADREAQQRRKEEAERLAARRTRSALIVTAGAFVVALIMAVFAGVRAHQANVARARSDAAWQDANRHLVLANQQLEIAKKRNDAASAALVKAGIAAAQARAAAAKARSDQNRANNALADVERQRNALRDEVVSARLVQLDHSLYQTITDARTAGLLAVDAYRLRKTDQTREMLLPAAYTLDAVGRVALPPWNLGAVTDRGRYAVVLAGARQSSYAQPVRGSLVTVDLSDLAVLARASGVRASLMCGFDDDERVATADGGMLVEYGVLPNGSLRRARAYRTGRVRALSCLPSGDFLYVSEGGALREMSPRARSSRQIGIVHGQASGMVLAPSANVVAVATTDGTVDVFDLRDRRLVQSSKLLTEPASDCSIPDGCAQAVALRDDKTLGWYDAGSVHVAPLAPGSSDATYPCAKVAQCAHPMVVFRPLGDVPTLVGAGGVLDISKGSDGKYTYAQVYDDGAGSQRAPLFDRDFNMYLTPYDPKVLGQLNPFGSGLATESFLDIEGPLEGTTPNSQWGWAHDYGLVGHYALVPKGDGGYIRLDLDDVRAGFAGGFDPSYRVQMRDCADGIHAVTFDYKTGLVQIVDMRSYPPKVVHQFKVAPVRVVKDHYVVAVQLAYNPKTHVVSILEYGLGGSPLPDLRRYSIDGHLIGELTGKEILARSGLRAADLQLNAHSEVDNVVLSTWGGYVIVRGTYPKHDALLRADGTLVATEQSIVGMSSDEKIVVGQDKTGDVVSSMYQLPAWTRVASAASVSGPLTMAPDGIVAYYDSSAKALMLYDVHSWIRYSQHLPNPPGVDGFTGITFSADGKHLLASYDDSNGHQLGVYNIDPKAWIRSVCLMAGRPLSKNEFYNLTGNDKLYRNGCAPYANQMYRW